MARQATAGVAYGLTEELLYNVIDWLQVISIQQGAAAGVPKHKLPKFRAARRPHEPDSAKVHITRMTRSPRKSGDQPQPTSQRAALEQMDQQFPGVSFVMDEGDS